MTKKNILFLMTDQQQKYTIEPNSICKTPNIDKLRDDGIYFERAYTTNSICSPARASLMTGLLPHNHGMVDCTHNVDEYRASFKSENNTFSKQLKDTGYNLGYFGKWHVERSGKLEKFGFDEYETEKEIPEFDRTMLKQIKIEQLGYNDRILSGYYQENEKETEEYYLYSKGIDFIEKYTDDSNPWCLFISTYAPHDPYVAPKELYDLYDWNKIPLPKNFYDDMSEKPGIYKRIKGVWNDLTPDDYKKTIASYYASCTLVDQQVGRILETLRKTGQEDNTIIVFLTDHGDMMGGHGLFAKGVLPFEEVYNIPLIIKWPGKNLEGISSHTYTSIHDIAPTILEMANCKPLHNIDGESIVPYLEGMNDELKTAFAEFHGQRMFFTQRIIWHDDYKYIFNGFDNDEFYDLKIDPYELDNKIGNEDYKKSIEKMSKKMWNIIKKSNDFNLYEAEYYMFRFAPIGPEKKLEATEYNK